MRLRRRGARRSAPPTRCSPPAPARSHGRSSETGAGLRELARREPRARSLRARYYERQGTLHGECFYIGLCEPVEETELLIRETADYIEDARSLAGL